MKNHVYQVRRKSFDSLGQLRAIEEFANKGIVCSNMHYLPFKNIILTSKTTVAYFINLLYIIILWNIYYNKYIIIILFRESEW